MVSEACGFTAHGYPMANDDLEFSGGRHIVVIQNKEVFRINDCNSP
jgi:hypothetical protein